MARLITAYIISLDKNTFFHYDKELDIHILDYFTVQELCTLHRLDAGSIATEWIAYKHSKKSVELALEVLETFEREVCLKKTCNFCLVFNSLPHSPNF